MWVVAIRCPEAQTAPTLEDGTNLVPAALEFVYNTPSLPDTSLGTKERDAIIRERYAAGVSQAELARQFGISYQRIHQIVHGKCSNTIGMDKHR
jgi:hypothetical protein